MYVSGGGGYTLCAEGRRLMTMLEGGGALVKGDTLTSGVYEGRGCQQTTAGRLKYKTEGEGRGGGPLRQGCV